MSSMLFHRFDFRSVANHLRALLVMVHSGSIAALGVAFGLYSGQVFHLYGIEGKMCSAIIVLGLTSVNSLGIRGGKLVQNFISVAKISGLAALIILLGFKGSRPVHIFEIAAPTESHPLSFARFGIALIAILWAYEGWHVVSFVAGEMKKNQPGFR
jgi:basic amino acid/polyamine antiporter, APA family